jgi:hypothetical protein
MRELYGGLLPVRINLFETKESDGLVLQKHEELQDRLETYPTERRSPETQRQEGCEEIDNTSEGIQTDGIGT